jgi:hypothetical protein
MFSIEEENQEFVGTASGGRGEGGVTAMNPQFQRTLSRRANERHVQWD